MSTAPATLRTGHVGLNVTDIARSCDFYRQVLGLEAGPAGSDGNRRWQFLTRDGEIVLTLWQQSDGSFPSDRPGLHHLSFAADSIEEVRAVEAVLRTLGTSFHHEGIVAHREGGASGGIFFTDPDGIRLEIYATTGAQDAPAPHTAAPTCGFF